MAIAGGGPYTQVSIISPTGSPQAATPAPAVLSDGAAAAAAFSARAQPLRSERVATILFNDAGSELSREDRAVIADIVQQQRSRGSAVRIVGHTPRPDGATEKQLWSAFDLSMKRANAVAREVYRLGVPANVDRVEAQTDTGVPRLNGLGRVAELSRRAEIFLEN